MICKAPSPSQVAASQAAEQLEQLQALAPRHRRSFQLKSHHVIAAVAIFVAAAGVAWFGTHNRGKRGSYVATNVTDVTAFPTTTTTPAQLIPLDKILVAPPHDFDEIAIAGEKNGPIGLADFDDPADRKVMQGARFTGGYEHVWQRQGAPDVIIKAVLEFGDEQHATDLYNSMAKGEQLLPGNDVPGAVIGTDICGCSIIGQGVAFRKGTRIFLISTGTTGNRFTYAEASALATEQYKAS